MEIENQTVLHVVNTQPTFFAAPFFQECFLEDFWFALLKCWATRIK